MSKVKVLLIIRTNKRVDDKSINSHNGLSNAALSTLRSFSNNEILDINYHFVTDNNEIWQGCKEYNPNIVIIDGLWVVKSKLDELMELYPDIKWCIRIHSDIPFIAQEGIFAEWCYQYLKRKNVFMLFNSKNIYNAIKSILSKYTNKIYYIPNTFSLEKNKEIINNKVKDDTLKIGLFGAARVLKNQLAQAVAALDVAEKLNKSLHLFINVNTKDINGIPIYLNILHLVKSHPSNKHKIELVEWSSRDNFLDILSQVDVNMQVSLSETFNLIGCESLEVKVPIIGSREIPWLHPLSVCNPTSHKSMVKALLRAYKYPKLNILFNSNKLLRYNAKSVKLWEKNFSSIANYRSKMDD